MFIRHGDRRYIDNCLFFAFFGEKPRTPPSIQMIIGYFSCTLFPAFQLLIIWTILVMFISSFNYSESRFCQLSKHIAEIQPSPSWAFKTYMLGKQDPPVHLYW
jgi:hypothetical protein